MILYRYKKIIILIGILFFFTAGYYLRSHYQLNTFLPGSPYEIYSVENSVSNNTAEVSGFTDKASRYPLSNSINNIIPDSIKDIYWIFLILSILVFLFAKKITKSSFGGFLALAVFAITGENLIHYTKEIGASGFSYFFILTSIFFSYKFFKDKKPVQKNISLILILVSFILNSITYHTGATALVIILSSILLISLIKKRFTKDNLKFLAVALIGTVFYLFWIIKNDLHQFNIILSSFGNILNIKTAVLLAIFAVFLLVVNKFRYLIKNNFKYLVYGSVLISFILIFYNNYNVNLSFLGIENYYISSVTLNTYLIQFILLHIYVLYFLPDFIRKKDPKNIILSGWLLGLLIVCVGLISQGYVARILDYSFFFTYILFAAYWIKDQKHERILVPTILALIIASQFMVFSDSFSMRRFYYEYETLSAQKVANLNLQGFVVSDLRTASLLSYHGYDNTYFETGDNPLHNVAFYYPELINKSGADYMILSDSMKYVLYSRNYPTTPINQDLIEYYKENYETIYNDNLYYVFKLK